MAILAFSLLREDLLPSAGSLEKRTLIQVSDQARRELEALLSQDERCCEREHLHRLHELADTRESDSELKLLLAEVEQHGKVFVRFL